MSNKSMPRPRFHSVAEIAAAVVVSTKTVRRWIHVGDLHIHRLGRQIRVHDDDLAAFLALRRRQGS